MNFLPSNLISGRLDDPEGEFGEAGDGGRDADDVDEQDQREDQADVAAEQDTCNRLK